MKADYILLQDRLKGEYKDAFQKVQRYSTSNRFVDFLKTLYRMAWIMLVFVILDLVIGDGVLSSSDTGAINIVLLLASVIITCVLVNRYSINVPAWVAVTLPTVYIVVYYIVNAVANYKKYGSIRKPKEAKLSFFGGVKESVSRELPEAWLKQWTKKNERRRRKGQAPLSEEEFMEKLDKQYDYRRSWIMNVLIFSACTFGFLLMELVLAAPPMKEFAWHAAILILCESGVCVFYSSSGKNACATYAKMRARMKADNLTLAEYVAKGGTAE